MAVLVSVPTVVICTADDRRLVRVGVRVDVSGLILLEVVNFQGFRHRTRSHVGWRVVFLTDNRL
jgi:hypothetical protein